MGPTRTRAAAWLAAGALLLLAYQVRIYENDTWGHLRYGEEILRRGAVPAADCFSFTRAGRPWLNHEWLGQALFAAAARSGGEPGLVLLKTLLGTATGWLVWRALPAGAGRLPLFLLLAALLSPSLVVRPQLFTYLGLAALLTALRRLRAGDLRPAPWLVPLFLLWANLHGGFVAGLGVLALLAGPLVLRPPAAARPGFAPRLALLLLLALLATLVTPWSVDLYRGVIRGITNPVSKAAIAEWHPLRLAAAKWQHLLFFPAAALFLLGRGWRTRPVGEFLLAGLVVLLPLSAARHLPLFAVIAPFLWGALPGRAGRVVAATLGGAVALLALAATLAAPAPRLAVIPGQYPVAVVDRLATSGWRGDLLVEFDWAQYVSYRLGPGVRVAVDGRNDNVYPPALLGDYLWRQESTGDWGPFLARYPATRALFRPESPGVAGLKGLGWRELDRDGIAVLLEQ